MSEEPVQFVLLDYRPGHGAGTGIPVLVMSGRSSVEVSVRREWEHGLAEAERDYLAELMREWRETEAAEIPELMRELAEISVGPLRTMEWGTADSGRRAALLQRVERDQA